MLIIGERINSTRKSIQEVLEKKDAGFIQEEAERQFKAGANFIGLKLPAGNELFYGPVARFL